MEDKNLCSSDGRGPKYRASRVKSFSFHWEDGQDKEEKSCWHKWSIEVGEREAREEKKSKNNKKNFPSCEMSEGDLRTKARAEIRQKDKKRSAKAKQS